MSSAILRRSFHREQPFHTIEDLHGKRVVCIPLTITYHLLMVHQAYTTGQLVFEVTRTCQKTIDRSALD